MARGRKTVQKKEVDFKRGNGKGSIKKLPGNRRNPYGVLITAGRTWDSETMQFKQQRKYVGYYPTREAAQLKLNQYNVNPWDLDAEKITFAEVYEQWSQRYYTELKNDSSKRSCIAAYNHSKPLHNRNFTSITVVNMKDTINSANVSANMQGRMKSLYNLMYDYAVEAEIVPVNVARNFIMKGMQNKIRRERKIKIPISSEHEKRLWDNIDYNYTKMILLGIYTGFRPHELCTILRENVNIDENYIIGGEKTEAGENRYVPIHPKILDIVKYYYKHSATGKYLISADDGQIDTTMTYDKYRGRFKKVMNHIGIPDSMYSPHCTRHTFVTKAKESRMDLEAIKLIAGHEINDVTNAVYDHSDKHKFLQEEILKLK